MTKAAGSRARLLLWSGMAVALAAPLSSAAQAEVRGTVNVSLRGTVAKRPFLEQGNDSETVAVGLQIDPSLYYVGDGLTTASLRGSIDFDRYDAEYGTVGSLRLNARAQHRLDERTSITADASVRSTRSAVRDFLRNPVLPRDTTGDPAPDAPEELDPGEFDPLDPDFTDAGRRGRLTTYQAGTSLRHTLSPLDSFTLGASLRVSNWGNIEGSDYRSGRATASYRRVISSTATLSANVEAGRADYEESAGRGDGIFLNPTVGLNYRLSETLRANARAGVSYAEVEGPDGQTTSNVGFAGSLGVCQLQFRGSICGRVERSARPTSFAGVTSVTSAEVTYDRTLGLRDALEVSARYSRRNASLLRDQDSAGGVANILAVSAGYNRQFAPRFYGFIRPSYAKRFGDSYEEDRDSYQISFGIRYRFGDRT